MTIKLHEIKPVNICHERLVDSAERVRVKISNLTNSAIDVTAVIAELTVMEGNLRSLSQAIRETYNNG